MSSTSHNRLRIASINTNGIRAAFRNGMASWITDCDPDIIAVQEVRAATSDIEALLDAGWHILHDECHTKGRAGVALLSKFPAQAHRTQLATGVSSGAAETVDSQGRWLEADYSVHGQLVTVVSCYVHSGVVDTPKQEAKWLFLDAMTRRLPELITQNPLTVVTGDLNVGHRELDIKNWRGNRKKSGFLPRERAYFDRFFADDGAEVLCADDSSGLGLGWIDLGRRFAGEVEGPYTWWSNRGQAFDNDTGWRIDYQMASPQLAQHATHYRVDRAASYAERWSDHAPVVVDYEF